MIEPVVDAFTVGVGGDTGAVASLGWVTPAPGRARRVMRTVSFFSGTEEVFGVDVFSGSFMAVNKILNFSLYLASRAASRQYLSPVVARFIIRGAPGGVHAGIQPVPPCGQFPPTMRTPAGLRAPGLGPRLHSLAGVQ